MDRIQGNRDGPDFVEWHYVWTGYWVGTKDGTDNGGWY